MREIFIIHYSLFFGGFYSTHFENFQITEFSAIFEMRLFLRPMELKELFTVLSFLKIDVAVFHFSLFLFLDFGTNSHQI